MSEPHDHLRVPALDGFRGLAITLVLLQYSGLLLGGQDWC